jgi:hypothetical protein
VTASPQKIKVGVAALMERINARIKEREDELQRQSTVYDEERSAWFKAAEAAIEATAALLQQGMEPEDLRYGKRGHNIYIDIEVEYPEAVDLLGDRELQKMKRHRTLLELAVDPTVMIDPEGEYARYL